MRLWDKYVKTLGKLQLSFSNDGLKSPMQETINKNRKILYQKD